MKVAKINEKVMSDEEKRILKESNEKARKEKREKKELLEIKKNELFETSRKNLPNIIRERTIEIANDLAQKINVAGFETVVIHSLIANPKLLPHNVRLTSTELLIAFDEFKKVISEINKHVRYNPTVHTFCSFVGITTLTYKRYLNDQDDERRNVLSMIEDYFLANHLEASQRREIDNTTALHIAKVQHNFIEQPQRIEITHKNEIDRESLMNNLNKIKNMGTIIEAEFEEK